MSFCKKYRNKTTKASFTVFLIAVGVLEKGESMPFCFVPELKGRYKMSEYYTVNEMYGEKFYQVPKVFFTNPLYKDNLTDTEKLAFGILRDRFSLSKKNGWFDDQGRIYFIFTIDNLMEIFDCSNKTASNIKKRLIKVGLLEVKKRGQGKADLLYLKKPIVTKSDIYLIDKEENIEKESETVGAVETCKNYTSKDVKNTRLEVKKVHANNTDSNNTDFNDTENLNPNLKIDVYEILFNTNIPQNLKHRIKVMIANKDISLTAEQILAIENAYFYQIQKGYIIPDCDFDYSGSLNDIEFSNTVTKMLETIKDIRNIKGLIKEWVQLSFEHKIEQYG
jgi:hypothetical protein